MASPLVAAGSGPRVLDPHKKASFTIQLSERLSHGDSSKEGRYSSVKYNHKPPQTSETRNTKLMSKEDNGYTLTLKDKSRGQSDIFTFTGQKRTPKKSYVLLFDPAKQTCTLEPLDSTYTFNLQSKNSTNLSDKYPRIRSKADGGEHEEDDLFDDTGGGENDEPDPNNPYDYRHFLSKSQTSQENGLDIPSSPDYRTGTGSAGNTPLMNAFKAKQSKAAPKPAPQPVGKMRKRRSPEPSPMVSKKTSSKASTAKNTAPTVKLERKASTRPTDTTTKPRKATSKSVIKSAEIVHSSDDESDMEELPPSSPPRAPSPPPRATSPPTKSTRRSPSPSDDEEDEEEADEDGGLLIEDPGARPKPTNNALRSLGLGPNLGLGSLRSPSNGPISLHSAANSTNGSPNSRAVTPLHMRNRHAQEDETIDFGDIGRNESDEDDDGDGDVEPMDIGPPATNTRRMSVGGAAMEDENDDDFETAMMEEFERVESSEESEEE